MVHSKPIQCKGLYSLPAQNKQAKAYLTTANGEKPITADSRFNKQAAQKLCIGSNKITQVIPEVSK
jgi:hypothetical protein